MADLWGLPVGLSDHTLSNVSAVAAVALGACVIEKRLTLRRSDGGPDAAFSLEPDELSQLVIDVREASAALGNVSFGPSKREEASIAFRRSLRASRPISAGTVITHGDVRSMRPAGGLGPDEVSEVVGKVVLNDLKVGDPITWPDLGRF
jgi:N-acetylneuraminate synthase